MKKLNLRALLINKIVTGLEIGLAIAAILVPNKKFRIAVASWLGLETIWNIASIPLFWKGVKDVTETLECSTEDFMDADLLSSDIADLLNAETGSEE